MDYPRFELAKGYDDLTLLPKRSTKNSAGYDFVVAKDIVIPSYNSMFTNRPLEDKLYYSLDEISDYTKSFKYKPTLVPTGVKAYMPNNMFLQISVRSSCPLKYWLILANGVGIIDSDYYGNGSNDGEIFFQLINFSPVAIALHKGDKIGQGIFLPYYQIEDDEAAAARVGGFGSTSI